MKFPIPSDWDGSSWCKWAVCWPDSEQWEGLLRGFLSLPQRGRTWDERTGSIQDIQLVGQQITEANLPLVGSLMSCDDPNLANSFDNIAAAIRLLAARSAGQGCCDSPESAISGSFQGSTSPGVGGTPVPIFGSTSPIGLAVGDYPPEFDSLEEYNAEKCKNAHLLVDALIGSLNNLAGFEYGKTVVMTGFIGVAIFAALTFPPSIIPICIGVLIVMSVEVFVLSQAADYCEEHKQELICLLYEGDNTEVILTGFADFLDIMVAWMGVSSPLGIAIKTLAMMLFSADSVNRLFTAAGAAGYGGADCTNCGCQELHIDLSEREFLAAYTWAEVATYDSVGTTTHESSEDGLQLSNPATPDSAGIFRFEVDNPDDLEFGRIVISNQVGACCNVYFFVLLEDAEGVVTSPFASNAIAGEHYESAANFEAPVIVKGLIVYAGNSINQGFDWTIEDILLTCAV